MHFHCKLIFFSSFKASWFKKMCLWFNFSHFKSGAFGDFHRYSLYSSVIWFSKNSDLLIMYIYPPTWSLGVISELYYMLKSLDFFLHDNKFPNTFCFFQTLRLCEHTPPRWNVQQTAKWITERRENQCHSSTVQHWHQWAGLISRQVRLYSPSQKRTWTFCVICNNTHSLDLFISLLKLTKYFIFTFKISVCVHFYQRHLCRPKV